MGLKSTMGSVRNAVQEAFFLSDLRSIHSEEVYIGCWAVRMTADDRSPSGPSFRGKAPCLHPSLQRSPEQFIYIDLSEGQ